MNVDFGNIFSESDMEAESDSDEDIIDEVADDAEGCVDETHDCVDETQNGEQCGDHDNPIDPTVGISCEENMDSNAIAVLPSFSDRDSTSGEWTGFMMIVDNLDKSINPTFQRLDRRSQLLHFVQVYAVLDRVDFSGLSDSEPVMLPDVNPLSLLPSNSDLKKLEDNCITMISRLA